VAAAAAAEEQLSSATLLVCLLRGKGLMSQLGAAATATQEAPAQR
jgi:hypothetical protein